VVMQVDLDAGFLQRQHDVVTHFLQRVHRRNGK
jgi:hypothetical protein